MSSTLISLPSHLAQSVNIPGCDPSTCSTNIPKVDATQTQATAALQIVFGVIGVAALVYIIIAGMSLITSQGDPQAAAKARQTIIYAVIGLIIAISAEVIVTFVLNSL